MAKNFNEVLNWLQRNSPATEQLPGIKLDDIYHLIRRNMRFLLQSNTLSGVCELLLDHLLKCETDDFDIVLRIFHLYAWFLRFSPLQQATKALLTKFFSLLRHGYSVTSHDTNLLLWNIWMCKSFLCNVKFMTVLVKFNLLNSYVPLETACAWDFSEGMDVIRSLCSYSGSFTWDQDDDKSSAFFLKWLLRFTALYPGEYQGEHRRGYRRILHILHLHHILIWVHRYRPTEYFDSDMLVLWRFFTQNPHLCIPTPESWKGFRRVFFIAKVLTEIISGNFLASSDIVQGIRLYFRSVPDPYISTDEVRELLHFFFRRGTGSVQEIVQNTIEDYERLFQPESSQPYSPRTLKHLCRCVVRDSLTAREKVLPSAVKSLDIPETLQQFLIGVSE